MFSLRLNVRDQCESYFVAEETETVPEIFYCTNIAYAIVRQNIFRSICRTSDPFNHIIYSRRLCFNNAIMLAVIIPHKSEYRSPNEAYDGKI